jgi:hypothetical protein
MQKLIDFADKIIGENILELSKAYYQGKNQASYKHRLAGLNSVYIKLNDFLPPHFRKGLSFKECEFLNTSISMLLTHRNEFN